MDKYQALDTFWSSFGIEAYDSATVPDQAQTPYITYESSIAGFNEKIPLTASLWYTSTSWENVSKKAQEIENRIGGGMGINYDGGRLWITKEAPFAQRMSDPSDDRVRLIILQITAEFQ